MAMRVREHRQLNPVADEVLALTAVVRPILSGVLYSLREDVVAEVGGRANVKLKMLNRLRREGDGDCGICFEYAVHDAMSRGDGRGLDRIKRSDETMQLRAVLRRNQYCSGWKRAVHSNLLARQWRFSRMSPESLRRPRTARQTETLFKYPRGCLPEGESSRITPLLDKRSLEGRPIRGIRRHRPVGWHECKDQSA